MKVCPNCGHELPDDTRYCEACGAMCPDSAPQDTPADPIQEALPQEPAAPQPPQDWAPAEPVSPPAPPQSGSKKGLLIGIAAAAVALCVGAVFLFTGRGGKAPSTPAGQFKAAQTRFLNDLFAASEDLTPAKSQPISTDLTLTAQYPDGEIGSYLEGSSIGIQVDVKENAALMGMDFIFKNTPIVSGALTYEKNLFGFCVPELADAWYTMDLQKFLENNAQGQEIPDLSKFTTPTMPVEAVKELYRTYLDVVLTMVTDENTTVTENTSFPLSLTGGTATGTVYTVTPSAKDVEAMLLALADQLENDTQIQALMNAYYGANMDLFNQSALQSGTPTMDQQLKEGLIQAAEDLRRDAKNVAAQLEAEHFTWTLRTDGKKISAQSLTADSMDISWEASESAWAATLSALGEEMMRFSLTPEDLYFTMDADGDTVTVTGSFEEKGGKHSGTVDISATSYGDTAYMAFHFQDLDPKKSSILGIPYGSYTFEVWAGWEEVSFSCDVVSAQNGGTDHVISFNVPSASTLDFDISKLSIILNSSDKPSTVQRPTSPQVDITNYTMEDFEALGNELSTAANSLLFKLMAALYS